MDITYQSFALILKRLKDSEGQAAVEQVELHGVPQHMESVDALIHKRDDRVRKEIKSAQYSLGLNKSSSIPARNFRNDSFDLAT